MDAGPDNDGDGVPDDLEFEGGCLTIQAISTRFIGSLYYAYDLMIDTERADFVAPGQPDFQLTDYSLGYVAGNSLSVAMPVTTTIHHKAPDPWNLYLITPYLSYFSQSNLLSTSVKHALTNSGAEIPADVLPVSWNGATKYDDFGGLKNLYRTSASQMVSLTNPFAVGVNQKYDVNFSSDYGLPAYECIGIPGFPFLYPTIPVCWTETTNTNTSQSFDSVYFDILPNTLDEFIGLASVGNNEYALGWDDKFPAMLDADGDGLISSAFGGLDPQDNDWDSDNDGLSDANELERRQAGIALSLGEEDGDGDGLTDAQELQFGTNPARYDTDNDGLSDGQEVRHVEYVRMSNGNVEPSRPPRMVGGWSVIIPGTTPLTIQVSSDPLRGDGDGDGVSDQAEKELAESADEKLWVDENGLPYHPNFVNAAPISVYLTTNADGGFVTPAQTVAYTTTVLTRVPLAPSVLNVTLPSAFDSAVAPHPARLRFRELSGTQTVAIGAQLIVPADAGTNILNIELNADVRARLEGGTAQLPQWDVTEEDKFNYTRDIATMDVTSNRVDRPDSFILAAIHSDGENSSERWTGGEVINYTLPEGTDHLLDDGMDPIWARSCLDPVTHYLTPYAKLMRAMSAIRTIRMLTQLVTSTSMPATR